MFLSLLEFLTGKQRADFFFPLPFLSNVWLECATRGKLQTNSHKPNWNNSLASVVLEILVGLKFPFWFKSWKTKSQMQAITYVISQWHRELTGPRVQTFKRVGKISLC